MRTGRALSTAAAGILLTGCYALQPLGGVTPEVGMQIAVDVNDAGRVALGGTMGPEIAQIEGTLVQRDSDMVVAVSVVHTLRGGEQQWRGEKVRIKPAYVSTTYERQFSRGRTIAVSAAALGAVALLASRSILGSGSNGQPDPPPPPVNQMRVPRP